MARTLDSSPYLDFDRETWRELRKSMPQVLTETEVEKLRGLGAVSYTHLTLPTID